MKRFVVLFVVGVTAVGAAPNPQAKSDPQPAPQASADAGTGVARLPPLTADEEESAQALVVNNCQACHSARMLEQQRLSEKQWTAVLKKMKGWGSPLEPEHSELLVRYLSARFSTETPPFEVPTVDAAGVAAAFAPQPDGVFRRGDRHQGQASYTSKCGSCHGSEGRGGTVGVNLVDRAMLYRASEFATVVRTGRGRMPKFESTNQELASMLAFLRSVKP